ncbi:MAG: NAD-dependent epimerase/dehydratase family protein [Frankiaceae bacterium]|nr:NAD-dependent epimerase/dehydratase family protein [Frankiaceae bacterium]
MKLLVLGGTRFVGRAVAQDAVARGWDVTLLNRGATAEPPEGVRTLTADRTSYAELSDVLGDESWDVVVDTWSGAPSVVRDAAGLLADRTERYGYVSSRSVYTWPPDPGGDETKPVVDGNPDAELTDYAADKRGGELAAMREYGAERTLLARAGLILGPYEDVGRLPWWLGRIARGGRVVAPGDPGRGLQYVDARDLAAWLLDNLVRGAAGAIDVVSPRAFTTIGALLGACVAATGADAELVWVPEEVLDSEGAEPWTQLPCWVPSTGELAGLMESDTSLAVASGLRCRPVGETVRDTWEWVTRAGMPAPREGLPLNGLPADLEAKLLARVES